MTTSYLDRGAGRIAYEVSGEGPLVVCLPGMGDLRSAYRFTVPALVSAGLRVATMDLRGHGDSDDGFDAYDDVAAGQDALALIEHLGGPAVIVGNSMGAGAGVWAAAEAPSAIGGLVLIGPFVRNAKLNPLSALALRAMLLRPWGPALWSMFYTRLNAAQRPSDLAEHSRRIRQSLRRGRHWQSFVSTSRTNHAAAEARLGKVTAPVLVIMGAEDPDWSDPADEGRFVAGALGGSLLMVARSGHYPMAQRPDLVNPAVIDFAQQVLNNA